MQTMCDLSAGKSGAPAGLAPPWGPGHWSATAIPAATSLSCLSRQAQQDESGAVSLITAIAGMTLIYSAAIALDLANVYYIKSVDQRIADQSAIAAAFAYASSSSTTTAQKAASSLATANGLGGNSTVATSIVNSPTGDGKQAAYVVVTSAVSLSGFGHATTISASHQSGIPSFAVAASAYAEIHGAAPCILALQTGGVTATGGTKITAANCDVSSNGSVAISSGPTLTAAGIAAVGAITATNGSTIVGPQYPNSSKQSDPYASGNVFARLGTAFFTSPTAPVFPTMPSAPVGGSNASCTTSSSTLTIAGNSSYGTVSASSYPTCTLMQFSGGGTTSMLALDVTGGNVVLSFAAGTYKIGNFTISNYGTTTINIAGSPVFDISNGLTLSASAPVSFNGTATWNVQGGISDSSSAAVTFSNSSTASVSTFTVSGGIAVTNNAASFPAGTYTVTSPNGNGVGLYVSGGATATLGNGSYDIADGISIGGGATLTIGGALNSASVFEIPTTSSGGTALVTGGGSSLSIGSYTNLDINGEMEIQGSVVLGAGTYTVNGALDLASSGGGSLTGTNVSLIASGPIAFGAGYSAITLDAPASIGSANEGTGPTVALASNSASASTIDAGASNTAVLGAMYFPNAALTLDGAGNLNSGTGCALVIAASIAMSGGSSLSTSCSALGSGAGAGSVSLVE
jgi:hypothetical protein